MHTWVTRRDMGLLLTGVMAVAICLTGCAPKPKVEPPAASANATAAGRVPGEAAQNTEAAVEPVTLTVFAGTAGKPGIDEVATAFEKDHPGVTVGRSYGGSGTVLSQMIVGETGDVYIPGSDDFMDTAEKKDAVIAGTRKIICYLVPVIAVQKGNPKGIKTLEDLAKPGVKVGIGAPKAVCLGDIALEVFDAAKLTDKIKPNIVTHAESCGAVETLLKLKKIDASIGWDVMAVSSPEEVEVIPLPEGLTSRRNIPAAVAKWTKNRELAEQFVEFIASSDASHQAFKKHGFTVE